jgi:hypothetical protein
VTLHASNASPRAWTTECDAAAIRNTALGRPRRC